ncbi:MAG: hypothetical protein ACYC2Y_10670 [Armatimonadota bacterium]
MYVLLIAVCFVLSAVPALATPLNLLDPFPKKSATQVSTMKGMVESPNIGSGTSWIYDTKLPFTKTDGFGKTADGGVRAWGTINAAEGFVDAELAKAKGSARATAYTLDLPTGGLLEGKGVGFRGLIAVSVWSPSPNGLPSPQSPYFLGQIIWTKTPSGDEWKVERWEWSGTKANVTKIAGGKDSLNFGNLQTYVNQIANGRSIGYYEAITDAYADMYSPDNYVHARLKFGARILLPHQTIPKLAPIL